ncbi:MAG: permease [Elusimicrobiota bacterium]
MTILNEKLYSLLTFFIYDTAKIFILLFVFIALIGVIRTYISKKTIESKLAKKGFLSYFFASIFGAITPFCSCSSIPIFISFIKLKIPLGVTFAFLITSPLVNEYLVVLMFSFFGFKVTALYVFFGMSLGIVCGAVISKLKMEKYIVEDIYNSNIDKKIEGREYSSFQERIRFGLSEAIDIVKKLYLWIIIAVAIGSLIHNYVPEEKIHNLISKLGFFSVPVAVTLGVPMYGSCAAILPIAAALFQKGIPLGTALSFMMAISALSLPEAIMLRRVIKLKLIAVFFAITTLGIIAIGYIFNLVQ